MTVWHARVSLQVASYDIAEVEKRRRVVKVAPLAPG
jgi:hypothetical protein